MAELLVRKTNRLSHGSLANEIGDVVDIKPNGHPWTPKERANFHILAVPDLAEWAVKALLEGTPTRRRKVRVKNPHSAAHRPAASFNHFLDDLEDKDTRQKPVQKDVEERIARRVEEAGGG